MTTTLDRLFLAAYFRSYLIVLTSLLSLYVVVDLFSNIDTFGRNGGGVRAVVEHVLGYYGYQLALIFDRLAEAITLLAAVFTVSWMQRNNELLPQLSAGIPTRRVVRPVLVGAAATLSLGALNQELVIPRIAEKLVLAKDDPEAAKAQVLTGAYDPPTGVHIEGVAGYRNQRKVVGFSATFPDAPPSGMFHLTADEAYYRPPDGTALSGGWDLVQKPDGEGKVPPPPDRPPANLKPTGYGRYFLYTQDVDYEVVTRGASWFLYASTPRLRELLARPDPRRQAKVAVMFHMRLTRPLVGAVLVLVGLGVILRDPNRHVFISAGLCLGFGAAFYLIVLGCKSLGDNSFVPAPLAAWLPVLVFGPTTLVHFDAVHT
ncbi:MAG: LptF/LptG family permease [Gemmataceae bacterium]|nr:LptF/LptG family permease [Gemmataceae bacterium]